MIFPLGRVLFVTHIVCRYRLVSLLPNHPIKPLLVALQYLIPSAWAGNKGLSEGERLEQAMHALGPLFIKLGQLLATRRDLLPPEWTDALSRLQDQVPPFPGEQARALINQELGRPVEDVFDDFDPVPLASASVAQVHTARLATGDEIVIKVIRPGIRRIVDRDLRILKTGAAWLERLWRDARYFRPSHVVADYQDIILGELDLLQEARNTEQMRRQFLFSSLLHIPAIHTEYGTRNIMVMERIHGIPVNDIERIRQSGIDPRLLAERGVEIFFAQVFRFNFFHADMHPGNIFVNPQHPDAPQYMAVDCAIVGQLTQQDLHLLGRLALMIMRQDFQGMVDLVVRAGWTTLPVDPYRFEKAIREIVEPVFAMPLDQLDFAPLVMKLFDTARDFHIEAPLQYILLLKTLVHVEGLGRSIYPQLDIWQVGQPLLEQWMMQQFGPTATVKKIQQRAPEWAAQLPELPELFRDALENLRNMPRQQRSLETRLEASLARHRRKLFIGAGGFGLLVMAIMSTSGPLSLVAAATAVLALGWALRS